ncbi:hypothetical protein ACP70R_013554 [Stipagrostis hirtigluma subsp. patula]
MDRTKSITDYSPCQGGSMDATMLNAYDQWLARREEHARLCAAGGEDRLGALPDDVLRLILRRLDTRSALATAALSRRWARLPRDIPVLEFKVGDVLPELYRKYLRRRLDAVGRREHDSITRKLDAAIGRYERQSMRSFASSVKSFLDADDSDDGHGEARRRAKAMTLELFPTHNSGPFNQLIATAVGDWGVQELEVVVLNPTSCHDVRCSFPHHCFEDPKSHGGVLKTLKLSNCAPLPACNCGGGGGGPLLAPPAFSSLAVLVLQAMPKWTGGCAYQRIIRACPTLETLHLKSCLRRINISIDAPASRITELVIDACLFQAINLRDLPRLESLACHGAPCIIRFGSLPRLARLSLGFYDDPNARPGPFFPGVRNEYSILDFSSRHPDLESLVVRFTGPEMWIFPLEMDVAVPLGHLRRLLLADMPRSWDMAWTCRVLEAARSLETLHVHVCDHDLEETLSGPAIPEPPLSFTHRALREAVVVGFRGTETQLHFVKFLVSACKVLESVVLLRRGRVQDKGLWDWEVAALQEQGEWSNEERDVVLREIRSGDAASSTLRIVLG